MKKYLQKTLKYSQKTLKKINIFGLFVACLTGEAPLRKAFWVVYVLFGLIQLAIIELIFNRYLTGSYITFAYHNEITDKFITFAFPYLFFSSMCVWPCGKNSWIEWNILSKCVIAVPLTLSVFHLVNVF